MENLKVLKTIYDKLGNNYLRSAALTAAGLIGVRKDLIRMDTNCCCNIHCIMCNSKPPLQRPSYMDLEQFKKIMDKFGPTARMLYLSCAFEPLMTPHFSKYLEYAKGKGIPHVSFCTNGLLLNDKIMHTLIENQIDEMILSFNGFCKEDYNRIMKGSDFDKVCGNLKKLSDLKKQYHVDKPKIRMNTVLLKSNLMHFEEMFQLIQEYDIDSIQFRELMLYEDQNDPQEVEKELPQNQTQQEYQRMIHAIQNITERLQMCDKKIILPAYILQQPTSSAQPTPAFAMETAEQIHPIQDEHSTSQEIQSNYKNEEVEKWTIKKRKKEQKHRCSIPFFSYWIDYLGNVRVCGYDNRGIIGNALTDSPKILAKKRKAFQKQALMGNCEHQQCTINVDTSTII